MQNSHNGNVQIFLLYQYAKSSNEVIHVNRMCCETVMPKVPRIKITVKVTMSTTWVYLERAIHHFIIHNQHEVTKFYGSKVMTKTEVVERQAKFGMPHIVLQNIKLFLE